jgi:hypothetical protein
MVLDCLVGDIQPTALREQAFESRTSQVQHVDGRPYSMGRVSVSRRTSHHVHSARRNHRQFDCRLLNDVSIQRLVASLRAAW